MTAVNSDQGRPTQMASSASGKAGTSQWDRVAAMDEFRSLLKARVRFVVPATIFFVVYYFALPISVGYFPHVMDKPVLGPVNIAYLFALSQFFMAWIVAGFYVVKAAGWDQAAAALLAKFQRK